MQHYINFSTVNFLLYLIVKELSLSISSCENCHRNETDSGFRTTRIWPPLTTIHLLYWSFQMYRNASSYNNILKSQQLNIWPNTIKWFRTVDRNILRSTTISRCAVSLCWYASESEFGLTMHDRRILVLSRLRGKYSASRMYPIQRKWRSS